MKPRCPQCHEVVGLQQFVSATVRNRWTCPRCCAILALDWRRYAAILSLSMLLAGVCVAPIAGDLVSGLGFLVLALAFLGTVGVMAVFGQRVRLVHPGFGFCQGCGYNLKGLSSGRCPECGRVFEPKVASQRSTKEAQP